MTLRHDQLVIGVDAGGSKTTAWIGHSFGGPASAVALPSTAIAAGHAGPGNMRAVGFEVAADAISAAIRDAFETAGLPKAPVAGLCISAAGAGRDREKRELAAWAQKNKLAHTVSVTGDAEPILAAASPDNVGIALISGTGSLAWGRNSAGEIRRTGGWGYLFGDEGSGYAIATAGLRAAAHAIDRRGAATCLVDAYMKQLAATEPTDLIECVYGTPLSRKEIAKHASVVFDAASSGDEVARQIVADAAAELAVMVASLAEQLRFKKGEFRLGLAGGVLVNQPEFRSDVIARICIDNDEVTIVPEPVAGALKLAEELARHRG